MIIEVLAAPEDVARKAATLIADKAREAVAANGRFVMAVSGGRTPWAMLSALAHEDVPWPSVHLAQVDERVVPENDDRRNVARVRACLLGHTPLPVEQIHAMPVESPDLASAGRAYADTLEQLAGRPAVLDLVHLGLGADGHTASLVPADPALDVHDTDVATTGMYQGTQRMTLTYPIINRARAVLWVVTGAERRICSPDCRQVIRPYRQDASVRRTPSC